MKKSSLILACLLFLGACSKVKKLDEMGDNTSNMKDTTQVMSTTTKSLEGKTTKMGKTTDYLLHLSRQQASETTRN